MWRVLSLYVNTMRCPKDNNKLKKMGISLVCPACSYKMIQPSKRVYPELYHVVSFPTDYNWSNFTATDVTVSGSAFSLSAGKTEGSLVSPQISNITRSHDMGYKRDITKIRIKSSSATLNDGRVNLYASNDGGTTWSKITDSGQERKLNYGNEAVFGVAQDKYDDLRIKIILKRTNASDTSPSFNELTIQHNHVNDSRKTISRDNIDKIILGE